MPYGIFLGATDAAAATNAAAELASGTGAAAAPRIDIAVTAGQATATGAAASPTVTDGAAAGEGLGTGAAGDLSVTIAASIGSASGTGAAADATGRPDIVASATDAAGSGAASNPTTGVAPGSGAGQRHRRLVRAVSGPLGWRGSWRGQRCLGRTVLVSRRLGDGGQRNRSGGRRDS